MSMAMVFRAQTLSETRGFVKALIGDDDRILGSTAFGVEGSEMMAVVQTAMLGRLPYTALRDAIERRSASRGVGVFAATGVAPRGRATRVAGGGPLARLRRGEMAAKQT